MSAEKPAERYRPIPRRPLKHRADCSDFYCAPEENDHIALRGPNAVLHAIEEASVRAGRTWNAQLTYVITVCRGECALAADDERNEDEWRTLFSQLELQFEEGEQWWPGAAIFGKPRKSRRAS